MTWTAFHRRGEVLRTVVETVDDRRDGLLPLDLPGVAETFRDELDLIAALSLRWHTRLSGNVERALVDEPLDLETAVAAAWQRTNAELPGIRMVLDHYSAEPSDPEMAAALTRAREKEWAGLAVAAGLASDSGAAAAQAGRQVVERSRATAPTDQAVTQGVAAPADEPDTPSLVDRIKAVIAA
ncbi:MAG TPA: hypothetical protein VFK34_10010 [Marmoricola sp.]|jgi:hypothetical protein|nr:hypothetical protein [Marmoricola sp.]